MLTRVINNLSFLDNDRFLQPTDITTTVPLQPENSKLCGYFICHFAEHFKNLELPIPHMNIEGIKTKLNKKLKEIIKYQNKKQHEPETNSILLEQIPLIKNENIAITDALNAILRIFPLPPKMFNNNKKNLHKHLTKDIIPALNVSIETLRESYATQPATTIKKIINQHNSTETPPMEAILKHFAPSKKAEANLTTLEYPNIAQDDLTFCAISIDEIKDAFKNSDKNSAPGPSGITYKQWIEADPNHLFLHAIYNKIIERKVIPKQWKTFSTHLVLKPGKANKSQEPSSWRPLAIIDTSYRIFAKILNERLIHWIQTTNMLSPFQKCLKHPDACLENSYVLQSLLEDSKINPKMRPIHICWLDFANAFGSIPHNLIGHMLEKIGINNQTIDIIKDLYSDNFTNFIIGPHTSKSIRLNVGVKQGCPLSMTIFSLCIDPILQFIHQNIKPVFYSTSSVNVLAYADDIVIVSRSHSQLQLCLDKLSELAASINLFFRPDKCGYLYTEITEEPKELTIYKRPIPVIDPKNHYTYLGSTFGPEKKISIDEMLKKALEDSSKILESNLHPSQKIQALKTFIFSRFPFKFRALNIKRVALTGTHDEIQKRDQESPGFDKALRKMLRKSLKINFQSFSKHFIYATAESGGLGIVPAHADYLVQSVVHAFRLFTTPDDELLSYTKLEFRHKCSRYFKEENRNDSNYLKWLSAELPPDHFPNKTCSWAKTRDACKTLNKSYNISVLFTHQSNSFGVQIEYGNERHQFSFIDRHNLCNTLHQYINLYHFNQWKQNKCQSLITEALANSGITNKFLMKPRTLSDNAFIFLIKARTNNLDINLKPFNLEKKLPINCRRCSFEFESLPHILNHCPFNSTIIHSRHNSILRKLVSCLRKHDIDVDPDTQLPLFQNRLDIPEKIKSQRPDLVFLHNGTYFLIDVKSPFDQINNYSDVIKNNYNKYEEFSIFLNKITKKPTKIAAFIIGSLGTYDANNLSLLSNLGISTAETTTILREASLAAVEKSHLAYVNHILSRSPRTTEPQINPTVIKKKEESNN